jgi:hypothetical protein
MLPQQQQQLPPSLLVQQLQAHQDAQDHDDNDDIDNGNNNDPLQDNFLNESTQQRQMVRVFVLSQVY